MTYSPDAPDGPVRVALVDDQPLVRAGLRMVINSQPDLRVVVEADDGRDALRRLATTVSDVVLMDVRMPAMDGLTATRALLADDAAAAAGDPRVIVLTTFDLDEYVLDAIRAGASGFLLKDAQPEELLTAIRTVHQGDAVIAPSSTRRLMERLVTTLPPEEAAEPQKALAALTSREREVLVLMARGRSNTEIASDLFVAEATVKTHVGRILSKLNARDRVQAVVTAYETGLVRPNS
ncbi:two component transcriptional regulator, LuxR family [Promicromonospora umidemergens]|uniref:Response regulator transcription factor n=1 Tax=Promicromonospora umidemergens TaxID=629679 RepID=A0ABP8WBP3_9MICO|nr:response regulator transcription factor [Promicromonospora umidemergens]MCP2284446.1 two component transcriptional regulator, LuxR family [Promicromonospora umidemergens]